MDNKLERLIQTINELNKKIENYEKRIRTLENTVRIKAPAEERAEKPFRPTTPKVTKPSEYKPIDWKAIEMKLGKYILQIIGMGVFLIGVGFGLKYAIEQGWIDERMRVIFGLVTATGLIITAELLGRKMKQWAQGCTAGGIVVYYLTFYAANNLYHLISDNTAFICFAATTVFASLLAAYYNSLFIAVFSLIGGFITPNFITSYRFLRNVDTRVAMSIYFVILTAGFLGLAYAKRWFILHYLSFILVLFYTVGFFIYDLEFYHVLLLLISFFGLFSLLPFVYALFFKPPKREFEAVFAVLGGFYTFANLISVVIYHNQKIVDQLMSLEESRDLAFSKMPVFFNQLFKGASNNEVIKYSCLFFGAIYLLQLLVLFLRDKRNLYLLGSLFALTIGFFAGSIFIQWSGYNLSIALHIYALILFILGLQARHALARVFAYIFWAYSSINFLYVRFFEPAPKLPSLVWNSINMSIGIIFVLFAVGAFLAHRYKKILSQEEDFTPETLTAGALLSVVFWFHTPVWSFPYYILGLAWYAFALLLIGLFGKQLLFRQFSYGICGLALSYFIVNLFYPAVLKGGYLLLPRYFVLSNTLFATFVVIFGATIWLANRFKVQLTKQEKEMLPKGAGFLTALLIGLWGRANIITHFDKVKAYKAIEFLKRTERTDVWLTIYSGIYALVMIVIGLFTRKAVLRYLGLGAVGLALWKLSFIIMAMRETQHRIITFLAVGILLIVASFLYQKMSKKLA